MERGDKTADDLDRPEGNDLASNYLLHDAGHSIVVERLTELGFEIEDWGIDMRDDDGEEGVIYDDKMDFRIYDGGHLVGLLDVKTKSGPKYMGMFNKRHYDHYVEHADDFDVPTYIAMFQIDSTTSALHDEFVFDVANGNVLTSKHSDGVRTFPDGNHAALIEHNSRRDWVDLRWALEHQSRLNDYTEEQTDG